MTGWKLSKDADRDLVEMFLYGLETYGPKRAEIYRAGIVARFENLARFPKMVRERTEFRPPVRVFHYQSHYIAYTIEGASVLILRIVRDEVDLERLFSPMD